MLQVETDDEFKYSTGGKRDPPDHRDHRKRYGEDMIPSSAHPIVDLRRYIDDVYNQGSLHNCTANAVAAAFCLELKRQTKEENKIYFPFNASRLFLFYNSRLVDKSTDTDTGVPLRFTLAAASYLGICEESHWPYEVQNVTVAPPIEAYEAAKGNAIAKYERLDQNIDQFRACLKAGFPFAFVLKIYRNFEELQHHDAVMPMPSAEDIANYTRRRQHAVLAVGYDDTKQLITVLNSWGKAFGDNGYFYMPYKYILDDERTFDFWKIEKVDGKANPVESIKKKLRDILDFDLSW